MRLPPADTERFYRVWFALLHYVNEQLRLVSSFPETPDLSYFKVRGKAGGFSAPSGSSCLAHHLP